MSAPPSAPSAAAPPELTPSGPYPYIPPYAPSAPAPPRRRTGLWVAIAVAVVVGLLILSLALVGILPIFPSSSSKGPALTYDQALPLADDAAQGTSGGSWALVESVGIMSPISASENLSALGSSGCNFTILNGGSGMVTLPSGAANQTAGTAVGWLFLYRNAAEEVLMVTVFDGTASALATIAAEQSCSSVFALLNVVPSSVIDSSSAAADVQVDAAAFLADHSGVTSRYALVGGISFLGLHVGAEWAVNYTTCPEEASTGTTGAYFNATLNATSGAVIFSATDSSIQCPSGGTINLVRDAGPSGPLADIPLPAMLARSH